MVKLGGVLTRSASEEDIEISGGAAIENAFPQVSVINIGEGPLKLGPRWIMENWRHEERAMSSHVAATQCRLIRGSAKGAAASAGSPTGDDLETCVEC